ncbi:AbrB/MazE/SpoVT family DNA-binding domain-containing protein [Pseudoclavibacter helvolus]|uniref:AbrB/MazE/SpoVT family DNA-binding domain-containing protein n=1 Tax=Pseudoclavibacter helvolus TaxID=255205 RepID=UPI0024AE74C1|nr:AbrB/MazE/SpoVT family DNA-binding domain-containing protein [Pseudoclavibacter helvolus]
MSTYVSIQSRGNIALPAELRKKYHLDESGAQVEIVETPEGIMLKPTIPVAASQAWFWQGDWQTGERQAESERQAGLGSVYETGDDFLASLD